MLEFSWRPYFSRRILDVLFALFTCTHIHLRPHGGEWIYSYWVLFTFWDTCKCFKFVDRPDGNTFLLQLLTVKVNDNLCFYVSSRSVDLLISSCNLWYFYARLVWNCCYRALFDCHYWTAALFCLANCCCFAVDIFCVKSYIIVTIVTIIIIVIVIIDTIVIIVTIIIVIIIIIIDWYLFLFLLFINQCFCFCLAACYYFLLLLLQFKYVMRTLVFRHTLYAVAQCFTWLNRDFETLWLLYWV